MSGNYTKPILAIRNESGEDITDALKITSLTYTEYASDSIDSLLITTAPNIKPTSEHLRFGNKLLFYLGKKQATLIGSFYIKEVTINYNVNVTINATAVNYLSGIKDPLPQPYADKTYKEILETIAKTYNLKTDIDFNLQDTNSTIAFLNNSPLGICQKIASELFCIFTIKNDTLVFKDLYKAATKTHKISIDEFSSFSKTLNYEYLYDGCIVINANELSDGCSKQYTTQNKGKRMLYITRAVKNDSYGNALAEAILMKVNTVVTNIRAKLASRIIRSNDKVSVVYTDGSSETTHQISKVVHSITLDNWDVDLELQGDKRYLEKVSKESEEYERKKQIKRLKTKLQDVIKMYKSVVCKSWLLDAYIDELYGKIGSENAQYLISLALRSQPPSYPPLKVGDVNAALNNNTVLNNAREKFIVDSKEVYHALLGISKDEGEAAMMALDEASNEAKESLRTAIAKKSLSNESKATESKSEDPGEIED